MNQSHRKRKKLHLDPTYDRRLLSISTRRKWNKILNTVLPRILLNANKEGHMNDYAENEPENVQPEDEDSCNNNNDDSEEIQSEDEDSNNDGEDSEEINPRTITDDFTERSNSERDKSKIMFKESDLTVNSVMRMVAGYSLRFGLSNNARKSLINVLKFCAGPNFTQLNVSNYYFDKTFDPPNDKILFHYYCTDCYCEIYRTRKEDFVNITKLCELCDKEYNLNLSCENFFLSIDLRYQIELLLKAKSIRTAYMQSINSRKGTQQYNYINDIHDGELHKKVIANSAHIVSYNISTDGAPLGHKTKRSIWPLSVILNDLPPKIRFENVLLAGIMVVKQEPTPKLMNLYLTVFVEQADALREKGISMTLDSGQTTFTSTTLCFSTDSVARALTQYRVKYNGYFGCSYCYQKGTYISTMRYPFVNENPELRTHESHMRDIQQFHSSQSLIQSRGVKGNSVLNSISNFDMVWGFPFDYMHTILLGVVKHIWELWVKTSLIHLTAAKIKNIDESLLKIKPPHDVKKLPHVISDQSNYKAKDWKLWLLYYSIPICLDYIPKKYLHHYALLVKCTYILLKSNITNAELNKCEQDLMIFVALFEVLYGKESMRFNVHLLLHAVQSVRKCGPLWATSTFPFECNIYLLKQLVNGPKGVEQQIAKKSLQILSYKVGMSSSSSPNHVKAFCEQLFMKNQSTVNVEVNDGVVFYDSQHVYISDSAPVTTKRIYNKCIYNNQVYHSKNYKRSKKWNDTIVQLKCGKIVRIDDIINVPETGCHFLVTTFVAEKVILHANECTVDETTSPDETLARIGDIDMPHMWKFVEETGQRFVISIHDVCSKMVVMDVGTEQFICAMPNIFEID
ncbi:uncharacterized protein LOC114929811 [Nylanderia fulva]|uniref:uncharacterized protein LOC114929811 n=1 Tax=Nylanderia fulva TaxID=613905 RepID=UPI0010FACF33|nr:uncharacterized protein LOC114929811 [Nylanderia fulva]XP_029157326.1 uncharacterized protein LOC114929811 [Nylanderia fulva]